VAHRSLSIGSKARGDEIALNGTRVAPATICRCVGPLFGGKVAHCAEARVLAQAGSCTPLRAARRSFRALRVAGAQLQRAVQTPTGRVLVGGGGDYFPQPIRKTGSRRGGLPAPSACTLNPPGSAPAPAALGGTVRRSRARARVRTRRAQASSRISTPPESCRAASSATSPDLRDAAPSSSRCARADHAAQILRPRASARSRREPTQTRCARMFRKTLARAPTGSGGNQLDRIHSCEPRGTRCSPLGPRGDAPVPPRSAPASTHRHQQLGVE